MHTRSAFDKPHAICVPSGRLDETLMPQNHEPRSFRPAEDEPRPLIGAVPGALEAVRGEDGVWVVTLEETFDA